MLCCGQKNKRQALQEDEIKKAISITNFSQQEVYELRQRFYRMSKNTGKLRKEQFREHMGVLGLDTVFFLSDRIFTMLDTDGDGQINFYDFINYFNIITNGDKEQKAKMAFNYIDTRSLGSFELMDLKIMIGGIINSWSAVTGAHLNEDMQRRIDFYINHIFNQMNIKKTGKVTFSEYTEAIQKNPNILEIFEFLNKGITETIKDDSESKTKELKLAQQIFQVENQIDQVICILSGDKDDSSTPHNGLQQHHKSISFKRGSFRYINKVPSENDIAEGAKILPLMLTVPNIVLEDLDVYKEKSKTQTIQENIASEDQMSQGKQNHNTNDEKLNFRNSNRNLTCPIQSQKQHNSRLMEQSDQNSKYSPDKLDIQKTKKKLHSQDMLNSEGESKKMEEIEKADRSNYNLTNVSPSIRSMQKNQQGHMSGSVSFKYPNQFGQDGQSLSIDKRNNLQELAISFKNLNSERQLTNQINSSDFKHYNLLGEDNTSQSIIKKKQLSVDRGFRYDDENMIGQIDQSYDKKAMNQKNKLFETEIQSINQDILQNIKDGEIQNQNIPQIGSNKLIDNDSKDNFGLNNTNSTHHIKSRSDLYKFAVNEEEEDRQHEMSTIDEKRYRQSIQNYGVELNFKASFSQIPHQMKGDNNEFQETYQLVTEQSDLSDGEGDYMGGITERNRLNDQIDFCQPTIRFQTKSNQVVGSATLINSGSGKILNKLSQKDQISRQSLESNQVGFQHIHKQQKNIGSQNEQVLQDCNSNAQKNSNSNNKISNSTDVIKKQGSLKSILMVSGGFPLQSNSTPVKGLQSAHSKNFQDINSFKQQYIPESSIQNLYGEVPIISFQSATQGQSSDRSQHSSQSQKQGGSNNAGHNNHQRSYSSANFINISNREIHSNNDFIISANENNIVKSMNNSQVNININNNFFISHHPPSSVSPTTTQHITAKNNKSVLPSTNMLSQSSKLQQVDSLNLQNMPRKNDAIIDSKRESPPQNSIQSEQLHNFQQLNLSLNKNYNNDSNQINLNSNNANTNSVKNNLNSIKNKDINNYNTYNKHSSLNKNNNSAIVEINNYENQKNNNESNSNKIKNSFGNNGHIIKEIKNINNDNNSHNQNSTQNFVSKNNNGNNINNTTNSNIPVINSNIQLKNNYSNSSNNQMTNSNNLSASNSQISLGSNINQIKKSGFFNDYSKIQGPSSLISPFSSDQKHKQYVKSVNDMSNEQLKEKVIGLYQKFFDMKECLKSIRKDLDTNNIDEPKDVSIITERNNLSIAQMGRNQRVVSTKNLSPKAHVRDSHIIRQNSLNNAISNLNNDEQFCTMRKSTAINVPKIGTQKNQSMGNRTMVFFGHQNWNLVLNMMMGVQMAVKSVSSFGGIVNKLEPQDYKLKYYFELLPRRRVGEQSTFKICKFSDYAPQVFRMIRNKYNISSESYLKSIGPETLFGSLMRGDLTTLSELTSTGKSGSFFYYTVDSRFTLKTIHKSEFTFLKKILFNYHQHLEENPNTLIIRVYGLHKIKYRMRNSIKYKYIYFIIMSNVFHTRKEIHERFDLKGSLYKRFSNNQDPSVAKKDKNFLEQNLKIQVRYEQYKNFIEVVKKDSQFFESNQIIDYSMLLGLNYQKRDKRNSNDTDLIYNHFDNFDEEESVCLMKNRNNEITYHFGIIDILTCFGYINFLLFYIEQILINSNEYYLFFAFLQIYQKSTKKKLEFLAKRLTLGPDISTVPPQQYAARFMEFVENMFDDTSKLSILYQPNSNTSHHNLQINSNTNYSNNHHNNNHNFFSNTPNNRTQINSITKTNNS